MKHQPKRTSFSLRKRAITEEEQADWLHDTRHDRTLNPRTAEAQPARSDDAISVASHTQPPPTPSVLPRRSAPESKEPLAKGMYHQVDARTATRFRQGKTPIDGTLDLHGLSREAAFVRVMSYIQHSYDVGRRNILIITGRGRFDSAKPASERGILRQCLPVWLNDPAVRNLILAYDQAQIKDGGEGAFYVMIRRKRI